MTLRCRGVNEHSLVRRLEWICKGCRSTSSSHETTVVLFKAVAAEASNGSIEVDPALEARSSLGPKAFSVDIDPVEAGDSGDYVCLVNNRRKPNAFVRLLVQGMKGTNKGSRCEN